MSAAVSSLIVLAAFIVCALAIGYLCSSTEIRRSHKAWKRNNRKDLDQ